MEGVMNVWEWLTDPAHWTGPDGIPVRTFQTLYISAAAMIIAVALAFPIGMLTGHFRRFGTFVTNVGVIGRAVPTFALLIIFALMFLVIAKNPLANRGLIPYGILLKASFCSVALYHWISAGIPNMWKPFVACDLVFMILFVWADLLLMAQARRET